MIRRPNKYQCVEIKASRFLPPKGYFAITFFGRVLIHRRNFEQWKREQGSVFSRTLINHEWIHVQQAVSVRNSWIAYYLLYLYYFLKSRPLKYGHAAAYYANPFEIEAYMHEGDFSYVKDNHGTDEWRRIAQLSVKERIELCKQNNLLR